MCKQAVALNHLYLFQPELVEKLIVVDISPINLSPNINEMPIILDVMSK